METGRTEYTKIYSKTYMGDTSNSQVADTMNPINLYSCGREGLVSGSDFGPYDSKYYVVFITEGGKVTYRIGEEEFDIAPGDMFMAYPGEQYYVHTYSNDPWCYMWVGFNGHQASQIAEKIGFGRGDHFATLESTEQISCTVDRMLDAGQIKNVSELKRMAALCDILALMMEMNCSESVQKNAPEMRYVNLAVRIISESYAEKIKISEIADRVGINRSYLSNLFRQEMGISPQEFLINFRLEKAAKLLKETHDSVGNIAAAVGYADALAFSKAFKQKYSLSPRNYRNSGLDDLS